MPKISKAGRKPTRSNVGASTRPGAPPPEREKLDKFMCTRCGKVYTRQKNNFPASQSPLYTGNGGGYLPVCCHCVENLYEHYRETLGNSAEAVRRICMKFDIYWSPEIYNMINRQNTSASRVRAYISKTFLIRYIGKTYDDTLDEENGGRQLLSLEDVTPDPDESPAETARRPEISPETILFWGEGFDGDMYRELDMRFERWTKDLPKPLPVVEESLYKQICIQEAQINRKAATGQDVEKGQSALNGLLSSLNVKPNQKKDDDTAELESTPLGVWARRWEEKRPIPDYDIPEPRIVRDVIVWLYGHLGKAFGLKNVHTQLYDEEMDRYRVSKPEYENDDDDEIITDVFSLAGSSYGGDQDEPS